MVVRQHVASLQTLCYVGVEHLASHLCCQVSYFVSKTHDPRCTELLEAQVKGWVDVLRDYLWAQVVVYNRGRVFSHFLEGIIAAVEGMKAQWKLNTKMPEFTLKVWSMTKVSEALHYHQIKEVDLETVPKMMRGALLRNLDRFKNLRKLIFGSSTGDLTIHVTKGASLYKKLCDSVTRMHSLVHFSFQYNCTYDVLKGLQSARFTLKCLDIEHSLLVNDECLPLILKFSKLYSLAMSKTKLSTESQAEIIKHLSNICVLPRGDFLCDALEIIDWETPNHPPLKICNFWASEIYYFHSTEQMILTSKRCPEIQEMLFMFQDRYTCDIECLANFKKLRQLELWGGNFYVDNFTSLLFDAGQNLNKLDFHHLENLDLRALSVLNLNCPGLKTLKFNGCYFLERQDQYDSDTFELAQQRREDAALVTSLQPWQELEELFISDPIPQSILSCLLGLSISVKRLGLGTGAAAGLTDDFFDEVLHNNKFVNLRHLEIRNSESLTMKTVSNILLYCDNIETILDLEGWSKVYQGDIEELEIHMKNCNVNIKLRESGRDSRYVSLYQMCQTALKEKFPRVEGWEGEQ